MRPSALGIKGACLIPRGGERLSGLKAAPERGIQIAIWRELGVQRESCRFYYCSKTQVLGPGRALAGTAGTDSAKIVFETRALCRVANPGAED